MGMFLSLSGIVGRTHDQVRHSLEHYATANHGGLKPEVLTMDDQNCCVIEESSGNTTVVYPYRYLDWEKSSEFISRDLAAPVFSFHIHDGDLWMYTLYVKGQIIDQFNPIPDYWDDSMNEEEIGSWRGNASIIVKHVPGLTLPEIEKYLTRWNLDDDEAGKAYEDDVFGSEDWQLLDFMRKCKLPYPFHDDGNPKGATYRFWTDELSSASAEADSSHVNEKPYRAKPWWKFWA